MTPQFIQSKELTTKVVAKQLKITRPRLSQLIILKREQLGPIKLVGNVQVFTPEQVVILNDRIKKRGRVPRDKASTKAQGKH